MGRKLCKISSLIVQGQRLFYPQNGNEIYSTTHYNIKYSIFSSPCPAHWSGGLAEVDATQTTEKPKKKSRKDSKDKDKDKHRKRDTSKPPVSSHSTGKKEHSTSSAHPQTDSSGKGHSGPESCS